MTVIMEEDEDESRATVSDPVPIVKPPVIKPSPPVAAAPSNKLAEPKKLSHAATIKTNTRRISNIDRLKVALAVRQ